MQVIGQGFLLTDAQSWSGSYNEVFGAGGRMRESAKRFSIGNCFVYGVSARIVDGDRFNEIEGSADGNTGPFSYTSVLGATLTVKAYDMNLELVYLRENDKSGFKAEEVISKAKEIYPPRIMIMD